LFQIESIGNSPSLSSISSGRGSLLPVLLQWYQVNMMKSSAFGVTEGEDPSIGTRSVLEFLVLEGVFEFLKVHFEDTADAGNILILYNAIVDIANSFEEKLPIQPKDSAHIATFLKEHQHNLDSFTALCHAQLQLCIASTSIN
jgi:hypothetical protein